MVDKESVIPLYHQIKEDIIRKIESGEFVERQKIDGEHAFAEKYGVSQITVRKALSDLVTEGYLYRIRGKGTYVAERRSQHSTSLNSFMQEMKEKGDGNYSTQILSVEEICSERISSLMSLAPAHKLIKIKRLRMMNNQPVGIQTSYVPVGIVTLSTFTDIDQVMSLYAVFKRCGTEITFAREIYRAVTVNNGSTKKLLKANWGDPAFFVSRYGYTRDKMLLEYTESILLGDKYELVTQTSEQH